jgi:predicted tellurium resistance membrane protein TerC
VIAYRRKLDKFVIFTLTVVLEALILFKWKNLKPTVDQIKEMKRLKTENDPNFSKNKLNILKARLKKNGLKIRRLDNMSFVITLICALDVVFYSLH